MSLEVERPNNQGVSTGGGLEKTGQMPARQTADLEQERRSLLVNRNFSLLWLGQTISIIGDYLFDATLMLWIATRIGLHQPWAPVAVSGVFIAACLPIFLVGPIAGVFVDRWPKRQTMMLMDLIRALLIGLLLLTALSGRLPIFWQLGIIYGVVLLASTCSQFFNPARLVLIGDIVAEPARAHATGLLQMAVSLATIFGPALAAVLFSTVGVSMALAFNALSFALSCVAIWAMRVHALGEPEAPARQAFWTEFREGWAVCIHNRALTTVIVTLFVSLLGIGSVNALSIFFVEQNLHTAGAYYSILAMALGIGTAAGAIGAGIGAQRLGLTRTLWLAMLGMSVIFFVFSRLTSFPLAVIMIFLLGLPISAFNVASVPLMLKIVPRELVGRVAAVVNPLQSLALMLSVFIAGTLESTVLTHFHVTLLGVTFGPVDTIFTGVAGLVLIAGLYAMTHLKAADVEPDPSMLK